MARSHRCDRFVALSAMHNNEVGLRPGDTVQKLDARGRQDIGAEMQIH